MSLDKELKSRRIAKVNNRILILDCERLDGISEQHWWSRGDLKQRYVHYETVTRHPRVTMMCAKWYDRPDVMAFAEWDTGGRKKFIKNIYNLVTRADIIVGHFIDKADIPWLRATFAVEADLPPLPPYKTVDTYKVLKTFGDGIPFKALSAFNNIVGIDGKTDEYDRHRMERAVAGSEEDRDRLTAYCMGDVLAAQALYDWCRPHITNHPALFVDGKDKLTVCNRCGSDTKPTDRRYVANVMTYSMRKCTKCQAYVRLSIEPERMSVVRGV